MIVHQLTSTGANPLAGVPATEAIGIDPDAFVPTGTAGFAVNGAAVSIPVPTLGSSGSPEQLIAGSFIDQTQAPTTVITCTGTDPVGIALTGCTAPSTLNVAVGDLIVQVLGFLQDNWNLTAVPPVPTNLAVPGGPDNTLGTGGAASLPVAPTAAAAAISINTTPTPPEGFTNPLTGTLFNNTVPIHLYVDGHPLYCTQGNANPTTTVQTCTSESANHTGYTPNVGDPITGDPIILATAYNTAGGQGMTNGLLAPDGIVGILPSYPGAPAGSTVGHVHDEGTRLLHSRERPRAGDRYDDLTNPATTGSPSNLNTYANNDAANGTSSGAGVAGTDTGGLNEVVEMRWPGSAGSIINNNGTYELFPSGAWAADGDSDAFNNSFYATSIDGEHWTVPIPVVSTDYSFAASITQDSELAQAPPVNAPLGVSAYYAGRAYGPDRCTQR
jgi:hypothetical protein